MARRDPYLKALAEAMAAPAATTVRPRSEIEGDIAVISAMLRGPLSNVERVCLVEDKTRLRKQLAEMDRTP